MSKNTPQTTIVLQAVQKLGHATNQELHEEVRKNMPDLSITTVHRITKRLVSEGLARCTQRTDGVSLVDARTDEHSHFICLVCQEIHNVDVPIELMNSLQAQLNNSQIDFCMLSGTCRECRTTKEKL